MYHLISKFQGKVYVVHASVDVDNNLVFHGRYSRLQDAAARADELNGVCSDLQDFEDFLQGEVV